MKRYGNLFDRIVTYDNLMLAYENASRHRKWRREIMDYASNLDANLLDLQKELVEGVYRTSEYETFTVHEPKERLIFKLPFKDRIVHWVIMLILEPIWVPVFTRDTYSCIKGKGIHPLLSKLRHDLANNPADTVYCLKIDVRKFYPTIDHEIMKQVVRRKIKDKRLLMLLDEIIDSTESGVPIGNYLSQFFANLYLAELDHLAKEQMGVRYYYRFADDIVLLSSTKAELHGHLITINDYLNTTRKLKIKKNFQIFPVSSRGINYVGYITYHTHCLARKENKKKLARQVASLRKQNFTNEEIRIKAASRLGFMVHCNSINFLKTIDMKTFSEITNVQGNLTGDKYHIDTIIDREIHLKRYEVSQSKYKGECLTIQYEIFEQLIGMDKVPMLNDDGTPNMGWIEHITFTGSEALVKQLKGVELTEPVRCMIIKQPIGDKGKFFYKLTDPG